MERKALGKGIGALIPEKQGIEAEEGVTYLSLDRIKPSPLQPRENFNSQQLEELTQSIKEKGVIQPIIVRRQGDFFEIIAGERRFRAANLLSLKEIPVIIREAEDKDALELSLIENIQRQDLNPIEEAYAYQYLIEKFQVGHEQLSEILGKARVSITNTLRILKLPQEIQDMIKNGELTFAHGRALLEVEDTNQQRRLAKDVLVKHLSVRELENLIKHLRPRSVKPAANTKLQEPYLAVLEEELQRALGTKVKIFKRKKRGHIFVEFYSQEDLVRIVDRIRQE